MLWRWCSGLEEQLLGSLGNTLCPHEHPENQHTLLPWAGGGRQLGRPGEISNEARALAGLSHACVQGWVLLLFKGS